MLIFHFNYTDNQTKTFHFRKTAESPTIIEYINKLINRRGLLSMRVSQTYFEQNSVKINVFIILLVNQII